MKVSERFAQLVFPPPPEKVEECGDILSEITAMESRLEEMEGKTYEYLAKYWYETEYRDLPEEEKEASRTRFNQWCEQNNLLTQKGGQDNDKKP